MERGTTAMLVDFLRELRPSTLSAEALQVAKQALLDWSGVALAGSGEPLTDIICRQFAGAQGEARLVGRSERASLCDAALINGSAGHALDYDDTHIGMMGHPSAPVIPALLALAERDGRSGSDFLLALIAGIEAECRLGEVLDSHHYGVGFHSTGTIGTFGAAAASAHLLGLDHTQWCHALGLAGTQAAGLKSGFGTMAKPLHAGRAASNGLFAALVASDGFSAQDAVIEMKQGFAATHHGGNADSAPLLRDPTRLRIRDTLFKYHAACYLTHAAIEATHALHQELGCQAADLAEIQVIASPGSLDVCNIEMPRTGLEAKFSYRATVAMTLLGIDTSSLDTYSDRLVRDPAFVELRDRIHVRKGEDKSATRASVIFVLRDGQEYEQSWDSGVPASDLDEQGRRLRRKFDSLAAPVVGAERAAALADTVSTLDAAPDIKGFAELLSR